MNLSAESGLDVGWRLVRRKDAAFAVLLDVDLYLLSASGKLLRRLEDLRILDIDLIKDLLVQGFISCWDLNLNTSWHLSLFVSLWCTNLPKTDVSVLVAAQ